MLITKETGTKWPSFRHLDVENGSWVEPIPKNPPASASVAQHFYFNSGVLLSVAYGLRLSDLNHENVIAYRSWPCVVDAEFICQPSMQAFQPPELRSARAVFESTVLDTLMIPLPRMTFDPSALGLAERSFNSTGSWCASRHLPMSRNGARFVPADYQAEIVQGFQVGYRAFQGCISRISELVDCRAGSIRVAFRPTRIYADIEENVWGGANMNVDMPTCLSRLQAVSGLHVCSETPTTDTILHAEARDLANQDIPYFSVEYRRREVLDSRGLATSNIFEHSPRDYLHMRWDSMGQDDMQRQSRIIHSALTESLNYASEKLSAALEM